MNAVHPAEPPGGWRRTDSGDPVVPPEDPPVPGSGLGREALPHIDLRHLPTPPRKETASPRAPARSATNSLNDSVEHQVPTVEAPVVPTIGAQPTSATDSRKSSDLVPLSALACLLFLPIGLFALVLRRRSKQLRASGSSAAALAEQRCRTVALVGITVGLASIVALLATVSL